MTVPGNIVQTTDQTTRSLESSNDSLKNGGELETWRTNAGFLPYAHQIETTKFVLQNKRAFILNEMGTGKTLSILWAIKFLQDKGRLGRVLISCPMTTMQTVWVKHILEHFPKLRYAVCHGSKEQRIRIINNPAFQIVIINHDGVAHTYEYLSRVNWQIIIIDELTAFKNHSANRTKAMGKLCMKAQAVWGLTGEPTPNSPLEAYSQGHVVNPFNKYLPRYYTQFRNLTMFQVNTYLWLPKPEAPKIVANSLLPAIRFKMADCIDLPPVVIEDFEIPFTDQQAAVYERIKRELYLEHERGTITVANAAVQLNKLLQISAGAVKQDDGSTLILDNKPRLQAVLETYESTPQKKLIIFAAFRAVIEHLTKFLLNHKIKAEFIHGDVKTNNRTKIINEFQSGDLNVVVLQPQTTAHGLTLVAANTINWFSLVASNELYHQANARIVRPGQTRTCLISRFIGSSAEKHIAGLLERKEKLSSAVLQLFDNHSL